MKLQSPTVIRAFVALSLLIVDASLIRLTFNGSLSALDTVHMLALLTLSLAAYSWVLYPFAWSVVVSVLTAALLLWAWAVHQAVVLGIDLAALGLLLVIAGWQRRMRDRRTQQMQQRLEDVREEQTVKGQAIALAQQAHE